MIIRSYAPGDRAAVRMICIRTGASGSDATGTTIDDGLLPDVYASPYVEFAPELAFVVDDEEGAAGYVIGVADTVAFVEWYRAEWMPLLTERYANLASSADPLLTTAFAPEQMLIDDLADYPAHLHIDLLPSVQGRGFGRTMIERECAALAALGVPGVHLGVGAANTGAIAFYSRVGFTELGRDADSVTFGRRL